MTIGESSEDRLLVRLRSKQALDRARAAREAGERKELDRSYVDALRDLLDDGSTVADPDHPPGYDWDGSVVWPGTWWSVADEAANALCNSGGNILVDLLGAELCDPLRCVRALRHTLQIFGASHPFIAQGLAHEDRSVRETLAALVADSHGLRLEAFPVFVPALVDESDAVVASILRVLLRLRRLPARDEEARARAPTMEAAKTRLENATSDARVLRTKALAIAAMASESWDELAAVCERLDDVGFDAVIEIATLFYFHEPHAVDSLAAHPTLRARTRSAAIARFGRGQADSRYNERRVLAAFAPDRELFALVLEDVRATSWAIENAARFAAADATLLPPLVMAICAGGRISQLGAIAARDLIERDPAVFAKSLASEPSEIEQRLAKLARLLQELPSSVEGAEHIERVRALIAAEGGQPQGT